MQIKKRKQSQMMKSVNENTQGTLLAPLVMVDDGEKNHPTPSENNDEEEEEERMNDRMNHLHHCESFVASEETESSMETLEAVSGTDSKPSVSQSRSIDTS